MAWVSPTGHNDPDSAWINEANVYDDDTGSGATFSTAGKYLELTLGSAINCDKIRVYLYNAILAVSADIDVYYSGAWHNIHSGAITKNTWVELPIGSTESVDKMRLKTSTAATNFREADFNDAGGAPPAYTPKIVGII